MSVILREWTTNGVTFDSNVRERVASEQAARAAAAEAKANGTVVAETPRAGPSHVDRLAFQKYRGGPTGTATGA